MDYAAGSYSTFDSGCRGDIFAVSPRIYPAPGWLQEYFDIATAMREATKTCALEQGTCYVVKRSATLPRCGQRRGRGECGPNGPYSPGFAGVAAFPDAVRREVEAGWQPVAAATPEGPAIVAEGCVLPIWQRIFSNGPLEPLLVQGPSQTYQAAVRAAMWIADHEKQTRLVYGWGEKGRPVPLVYVQPGGLVRSARRERQPATTVERMDRFELAQALAAGRGASLMPFGM